MEEYIKYDGEIGFLKVLLSDIRPFLEEYKTSLPFNGDNFIPRLQSRANHYIIDYKDRKIGVFAIIDKSLSLFYLRPQYKYLDRQIMAKILNKFEIENGFVQSWDYHMLPMFVEFHKKIELYAYQFQLLDPRLIRTPLFNIKVRLATMADEDYLKEMDFLKNSVTYIKKQEVWITYEDNENKLGLGIIQPMVFSDDYLDIGVFTDQDNRLKGIGRTTLAILMKMVNDSGRTPVAACSYQNHSARRTLESSGMSNIGTTFKFSF